MVNELKFLGRGSAFNVKEGNTSAYIKEDSTLILIDCGGTVFQKILELDLLNGVNKIDIFITHLHPDHIGSLGDLLFYANFVSHIKPIIHVCDIHYDETFNIPRMKRDVINLLYLQGLKFNEHYTLNVVYDHYPVEWELYSNKLDIQINYLLENNHSKTVQTHPLYIKFINTEEDKTFYIFYSSDTIDTSVLEFYLEGLHNFNLIYFDSAHSSDPEYPHCNIEDLYNTCIKYETNPNKIRMMHIDNDEVIEYGKQLGFMPVEVEKC